MIIICISIHVVMQNGIIGNTIISTVTIICSFEIANANSFIKIKLGL